MFGGDGNDIINLGTGGYESADGGNGNDIIYGTQVLINGGAAISYFAAVTGAPNNLYNSTGGTYYGGAGNDLFISGNGQQEYMRGGTGSDTVSYELYTQGVIANANSTGVGLGRLASSTTLTKDQLENIENLIGSNYNDQLSGDNGVNLLNGAGGNDLLIGGLGIDTLIGGLGADTFRFNTTNDSLKGATDTITDFVHGTDHISLSNLIANSFSGLAVTYVGGNTIITDVDSDFSIKLNGVHTIDASDFLFV